MSASRPNSPCLADQVVLVAAVGVARRVGVVLEQVDVARDAFLAQPPVRVHQQALEDPLARLVVHDQVDDVVALGRGVLGMAADVQVEPRPVAQEHVAAPAPRDHAAEEVPGYLVRGQPPLPRKVQVTPYSFSSPKIRLSMVAHQTLRHAGARPRQVGPVSRVRRRRGPALHAPRHQLTAMYLVSVNSSNPSWPPSRPIPDCLTPPKGAAGSETTPRLIPIIPASRASATRSERRRSRV